MDELKVRRMEGNAINQLLRGFCPLVFSIADDRVAYGRKLGTNLILQSCRQFNANQRGICKHAFNAISQFSTGRVGISRRAQLLKHSFPAKIVHEPPCLNAGTAAYHREVLSYRSMVEKLLH